MTPKVTLDWGGDSQHAGLASNLEGKWFRYCHQHVYIRFGFGIFYSIISLPKTDYRGVLICHLDATRMCWSHWHTANSYIQSRVTG